MLLAGYLLMDASWEAAFLGGANLDPAVGFASDIGSWFDVRTWSFTPHRCSQPLQRHQYALHRLTSGLRCQSSDPRAASGKDWHRGIVPR
jgi:hypothetical protein